MAKATLGSRKSTRPLISATKGNLSYGDKKSLSLDEVLGMLPLEQMRKDIEDLKNKPLVMEIQPSERIVEHHVKTVNVTHENTKTIDKRARKYSKLLRKELKDTHNRISLARDQIIELHNKVKELQSRKPEEKQILTVETRTVETVKEIEYTLDKRVLVVLGVSLLMNIMILILK